jgi:SAM-dependent methyltransferase
MRSRTPNEEELLLRGTRDHYEDAALYDFEYEDRGVDIVWYRRLAARLGVKQRILELGAGTGRITVPLLEAGHVVTALDKMPPMLELLQAKAAASPSFGAQLAVVVGDMTALPLADGAFDLVIAPFNALQHLYSYRELLACFCEARRVLAPGGTFAFDVLLPDLDWLTWDPDERHAVTHFKHPTTGEPLVYSTNHTYDAETQVCHVRIYYDDAPRRGRAFKPPPKPRRLVHLAHRQIFPEEIRALIAGAGLELEELSGDFSGMRLRTGVQSQVVRARRPLG